MLSEKAQILQNVLAFFDPNLVLERLILKSKAPLSEDKLMFLFNEPDFSEAVLELTRAGLVTRIASSEALSVHRPVQALVLERLTPEDRIVYFDLVVNLLFYDFPNTWNAREPHQGHGYQAWESCSSVIVHIEWLIDISKEYKVTSKDYTTWAELIFRAGTYLWEREKPTSARLFFEFGLSIDIDKESLLTAQAYRLMGHVSLDLARPRAALEAYKEALTIRERIEPLESPPIADIYDSIACSLTEIGDVDQAQGYLAKAMAIHLAHDPLQRTRTEAIRALTFLRAHKPQDSLQALQKCWELQGLMQDQVEASNYPKHSGDLVILARIYWMQDEKDKAQVLMSRTIDIRKGLFGQDRSPRVADSIFHLARILEERGQDISAAKLLRDILDMSEEKPDMRAHFARALWFLAAVEKKMGSPDNECDTLRERARAERKEISWREGNDADTDESFISLVSWMLW